MPRVWPERFCCEEDLALIGYDGHAAAQDLASLREAGPRPITQELIDVIVGKGVQGATVIDIGAGVGAIHLRLLEAGAARAVDVDASREFLAAARDEAARLGVIDRVEYRYGDAVELAPDLPPADVVTLDSVLCCYPYLAKLLGAAVRPRPRLIGLIYPRDVWWMLGFLHLFNAVQTLRRSCDGYFIHRHRDVRGVLAEKGYRQVYDGGSAGWRAALFARGEA